MIRDSHRFESFPGRRRAAAAVLAVLLNLALLPCSVALDIVEEQHDCCPPEVHLEPTDCCEIDEASVDMRGGLSESDDDAEHAPAPTPAEAALTGQDPCLAATGPPGAPRRAVPLHKLHCVYLN